ncbi:MAG: Hopanoid biosynthesis associated rane protein HpnM [Rhodospirillales bacterium]|nr:Hopanoid biosynthesis associated rane protein HpnM [Rhodospirillales bacterium]
MRRIAQYALVLAIGLICLAGVEAQAAADPTEVIEGLNAALLDTMKNADSLGVKGRYEKLRPVVKRTFDVGYMTRLSVGRLWGDMTPDQRQRAIAAFRRYITINYAVQFDGYSGETFKVLGKQQVKHGVIVRSQLVKPDSDTIDLNYLMHDNDTAWQVRDVYLQGSISQLATRRSEFTAILRSGGIEALIAMLDKKVAELAG